MKILFLSFYFEPDLSAGSFRNSFLFKKIRSKIDSKDFIHVITTQPNRYKTYAITANDIEVKDNYMIERIQIPTFGKGFISQIISFIKYYIGVYSSVKNKEYDIVYASSSKLFTAFLAGQISKKKSIPLYLDIRDIFLDSLSSLLGNNILYKPLLYLISRIENYTFSRASHINLVSQGFMDYFSKYRNPSYSFFTNGIDEIFLRPKKQKAITKGKKVITYAGNIGVGQGLEKVIPQLAIKLSEYNYFFQVIGDGGMRKKLEEELLINKIDNVEISDPVKRSELVDIYNNSDFLFLHLNDFDAFKKVIPSKLFEYAAFNKPILAGVSGFPASFIEEEVPNSIIFSPTKVDDLVGKLLNYKYVLSERTEFTKKYSREFIMDKMASNIINLFK